MKSKRKHKVKNDKIKSMEIEFLKTRFSPSDKDFNRALNKLRDLKESENDRLSSQED